MSLEDQIKKILKNFESVPSDEFRNTLQQIKPHFKNELISEYLQDKIQKILDSDSESDKK